MYLREWDVENEKVKSKEFEMVTNAIVEILDDWIPYIHTMTADNGKEFTGHETVASEYCT